MLYYYVTNVSEHLNNIITKIKHNVMTWDGFLLNSDSFMLQTSVFSLVCV